MKSFIPVALLLTACGKVAPTETDDSDTSDSTPDLATDVSTDVSTDEPTDVQPDETTDDCRTVRIDFQAEDMDLRNFEVNTSVAPEIGDYIRATSDTGRASIALDVPCADSYTLWGLVWFENTYSNSFYWDWDMGSINHVWDLMQECSPSSLSAGWYWDQVSSREDGPCRAPDEDPSRMDLTEGTHTFVLSARETRSVVAEFILTNDDAWIPLPP